MVGIVERVRSETGSHVLPACVGLPSKDGQCESHAHTLLCKGVLWGVMGSHQRAAW